VRNAWIVMLVVASCGGRQPEAPVAPVALVAPVAPVAQPATPAPKPVTRREQMMQQMATLTDEMCACKPGDVACAARVQKEIADYGQDNEDMADVKMSEDDRARASQLKQRLATCAATAMHSEFLVAMTHFRDEVCACADQRCVEGVTKEMQAYASAHPEMARAKISDEDVKIATAISTRMGECAANAATAP
jgi:hypothetical protein